jgi:hypothetical protein
MLRRQEIVSYVGVLAATVTPSRSLASLAPKARATASVRGHFLNRRGRVCWYYSTDRGRSSLGGSGCVIAGSKGWVATSSAVCSRFPAVPIFATTVSERRFQTRLSLRPSTAPIHGNLLGDMAACRCTSAELGLTAISTMRSSATTDWMLVADDIIVPERDFYQ